MSERLNLPALADMNRWCSACERQHSVPIKKIFSGPGVIKELTTILEDLPAKNVFLIGDHHTMPLAHDAVFEMLHRAGCRIDELVFDGKEHYILNEELIGTALIRMPLDTQLIVAIGSGTMNDLSRVVSVHCGIPYIIIGTAPSMDGYASVTSAVVMDGRKRSVVLGTPYGILADTDLMITAPDRMLAAGVGDILGKHVAIADWRLSHRETGEVYCPEIAGMIEQACRRTEKQYLQVVQRNSQAIWDMADTLILSGIAISMNGNSRPASGSEHQLAHHWEAVFANQQGDCPLHGNLVGFGTIVALRMYEMAQQDFGLNVGYTLPAPGTIGQILKAMGDFSNPEILGITPELFRESFYHGVSLNGRYTLLTHLDKMGKLDTYVDRLTQEFFGKLNISG